MATYAEYHPTSTMASSDFPLYPVADPWTDEDAAYLQATSSYPSAGFPVTALDTFAQRPHHFAAGNISSSWERPADHSNHSPAASASNSFDPPVPSMLSSYSDTGASAAGSSISSATGSPAVQPQSHWAPHPEISFQPGLADYSAFGTAMFDTTAAFGVEPLMVTDNKGCVDPALIQPYSPTSFNAAIHPELHVPAAKPFPFSHAPSPAPSKTSIRSPRVPGKMIGAPSPYRRTPSWQPYPSASSARRTSISSVQSRHSSLGSLTSEESNKGPCPIPTCGRHVKDLKAHMLTHQNERPEKCPIVDCDYHIKGFARKYDKNRHTLTHYKGTMVCGFCPGSGSAAEKSFNRADVFKRHLTSVHGVEQTAPNARRKGPSAASSARRPFGVRDVSGMCSTCSITFASAQEFYEHLDECVLRVVQQVDPAEAINEKLLSSMADDQSTLDTLGKHDLPLSTDGAAPTSFDDEDEAAEADEDADEDDNEEGADGELADDAYLSKTARGANKSRKAGNSY